MLSRSYNVDMSTYICKVIRIILIDNNDISNRKHSFKGSNESQK